MNRTQWLDDLQKNISDLIARSPAADIERNVRSLVSQTFAKLDLVTRDEFEIQADLLTRTRARADALEAQLRALEARLDALDKPGAAQTQAERPGL
ncbi:COGs COG2960 [plant metagenome]|uniref:Ubiquinone biosynthesis accessory factor UbiK n=2 Tax=root TaxID=1 RepID=A0A1C3K6Z6_9BURK|nr:accessory factor UbiK family protein [Orrella dioscoreae]SBT27276.1 COGs COG2960 [Orrella dioscoreae]SOE50183.1 COGs COG2960 [Orrella dioscoreae]